MECTRRRRFAKHLLRQRAETVAANVTGAMAVANRVKIDAAWQLLAGYSVSEEQARDYEELIKSGHVLVFVHGDPLQVAQAQTIFETSPPHILHLHGAAPESKRRQDDQHRPAAG